MTVASETLGFRRTGFSPVLTLLMSAFALPIPPAALTGPPSQAYGTLPYRQDKKCFLILTRGFGAWLKPR